MYSIKDLAITSNKLNNNKNSITIFENNKKDNHKYSFEINSNLVKRELGWKAKIDLEQGLKLMMNRECE